MLIAPAARCSDPKPATVQTCVVPDCIKSEHHFSAPGRALHSPVQVGTSPNRSESALDQAVDVGILAGASSSLFRQRLSASFMQSERPVEPGSSKPEQTRSEALVLPDEGLPVSILAPALAGSCAALLVVLGVARRHFRRNLRSRVHVFKAADHKVARISESLPTFSANHHGARHQGRTPISGVRFPPKVATSAASLSPATYSNRQHGNVASDVNMGEEADADEGIDLSWFRQQKSDLPSHSSGPLTRPTALRYARR